MKIKEIIKKIKNSDWWIEETPATHQIAEWASLGFVESSRYFHRKLLSMDMYVYKNDYVSEVTLRKEKIAQFNFAFKNYRKNNNYLKNKKKNWRKFTKLMIEGAWFMLNNFEKLSGVEIHSYYKKFTERYVDFGRYTAFLECVDPFSEQTLLKILKNKLKTISQNEISEISAIMSTPDKLSFMEEERLLFLQACRDYINKHYKEYLRKIYILHKNYFWFATHYGAAVTKSTDDFEREIKEYAFQKTSDKINREMSMLRSKNSRVKKQKKAIIKKYNFDKELEIIFSLVSEMGEWIDERKYYAMQGTYIIYKFLDKLERRLGVPADLLAYTTYDELVDWLKDKKQKISPAILKERRTRSVYLTTLIKPGVSEAKFIVGEEAERIHQAISNLHKKAEQFSGTVVSRFSGKIAGRVSLVLNTSQDKFKKGNILVTTMTRPDFLPMMRQAKAIITDEGGLTCHAAIVSRELGIPCVVGTKIATKVLKSGDMVEMDMEKEAIKIIKK